MLAGGVLYPADLSSNCLQVPIEHEHGDVGRDQTRCEVGVLAEAMGTVHR